MNICCTFDNKFYKYIINLVNSIYENNGKCNYYFIINDLNVSQTEFLNNKLENKGDITFIDHKHKFGSKCEFKGCRINSYAIYNTTYIASLFDWIDKIIYIDVDSIILANIKELLNIDLGEKGIAAVPDLRQKDLYGLLDRHSDKKLMMDKYKDIPVFNNSLMVMDLKVMRKNKAENYMHELLENYKMSDMCIQNIYADGKFIKLDRKWCISANYVDEKEFRNIKKEDWKILTWHGNKPWSNGKLSNYWRQHGSN